MKKTIIFSFLLAATAAVAQPVAKKVVVEHFTNTLCGICASRNPGLYTTLAANPNVLHLSVHPSSPYSSCVFNTHNVVQNDGRTNYYGVYGGTPRIVVQGVVQAAGVNFATNAFLTPFQNQTTPVSIRVKQYKYGTDSMVVKIIIKTVAANTLGVQRLFVAVAEKTKNYAAPNGESVHHDVFRKSLVGPTGATVIMPAVGDSSIITARTAISAVWDISQVYAIAILQTDATKAATQAEAAPPTQNDVITVATNSVANSLAVQILPNPARNFLNIGLEESDNAVLSLYTIDGKLYHSQILTQNNTTINTQSFAKGLYFIHIATPKGVYNGKIVFSD